MVPVCDRQDFDDVERGFIATLTDPLVRNASGTVVWDANAYDFIDGDAPDTVNASLWRQGKLVAKHGLFEVVPGIYQARGLDISNISFVEGNTGVIIIDPLMSVETAAAALALYREHRGDRPVVAVIHTHSHADHYAGVAGVADASTPIIAPAGFLEHSVSENVYAGAAMSRRAAYMYASDLGASPTGQMGVGLGMATSMGTMSLMPPTVDITHTGQEETVDGVRIVFQVTPGTEAPAEMNFYFPDFKAACMAENATHTLHNLLTLRGAEVRDARAWSRYLNESIALSPAERMPHAQQRGQPSTRGTSGGPRPWPATSSSRTRPTPKRRLSSPTRSSNSASGPRTAPGETSSSAAPLNCARRSPRPRPTRHPPAFCRR